MAACILPIPREGANKRRNKATNTVVVIYDSFFLFFLLLRLPFGGVGFDHRRSGKVLKREIMRSEWQS